MPMWRTVWAVRADTRARPRRTCRGVAMCDPGRTLAACPGELQRAKHTRFPTGRPPVLGSPCSTDARHAARQRPNRRTPDTCEVSPALADGRSYIVSDFTPTASGRARASANRSDTTPRTPIARRTSRHAGQRRARRSDRSARRRRRSDRTSDRRTQAARMLRGAYARRDVGPGASLPPFCAGARCRHNATRRTEGERQGSPVEPPSSERAP